MSDVASIAVGGTALASDRVREQAGTRALKITLASQDQQGAAAIALLEQAAEFAQAATDSAGASQPRGVINAQGRLDTYG